MLRSNCKHCMGRAVTSYSCCKAPYSKDGAKVSGEVKCCACKGTGYADSDY